MNHLASRFFRVILLKAMGICYLWKQNGGVALRLVPLGDLILAEGGHGERNHEDFLGKMMTVETLFLLIPDWF